MKGGCDGSVMLDLHQLPALDVRCRQLQPPAAASLATVTVPLDRLLQWLGRSSPAFAFLNTLGTCMFAPE